WADRRAEAFARHHGLATGAGSDAHRPEEVGRAGLMLPEFDGPQGFLHSLAQSTIIRAYLPPWVHFWSTTRRLLQRARRGPASGEGSIQAL
ncbi:MAG: hypothetical protein HYX99_01135, partial [Chloroflexi bacterium]|nr:hypothetical protein [Chloroflexota bacterium]